MTVDTLGRGHSSLSTADHGNGEIGLGSRCLSALLDDMQKGGDLPGLRPLVERLAHNCLSRTGISGVGVGLPVPGAGLLESGWEKGDGNCYLTCGALGPGHGLWSELPGSWDMVARSLGVMGGSGSGPWPASRPLPLNESDYNWRQVVMDLQGQPVLLLLMVYRPSEQTDELIEKTLGQMKDGLTPLLQMWATARRLEAELRQARTENQALARLNSLQERVVAMASHEFKTPLTSITAYTDALRGQITDESFPHATEFLGVIRTEAGRLLRMANRILDFSGTGLGLDLLEVQDLELAPLVQETVLALRPALAAKGLNFSTDLQPGVSRARIDGDLVRQVIINLLSNAIKFTPTGGQITVSVTEAAAGVRLGVADTGLGIPSEDLQRVFREFYRTSGPASKEEGTGLGLTIVRNIVNLHGGHVNVERLPVGGTLFSCDLPKEVRSLAPLPLEFGKRTDRNKAWSLIRSLVYMVGELTRSPAVAIELRDGRGGMAPVAAMGAPISTEQGQRWITADMVRDGQRYGRLVMARGSGERDYSPAQVLQLGIIADMAGLALSYLTPDSPGAGEHSTNQQVSKVIEAVRAILQIRRTGIPTSTPEAMDLVDKLGRKLGVNAENIRRLQHASLLHDAGMARVEVEIVMGESALSWDQRDEVERHVEQGVDLMSPLLLDPDLVTVIRHHHERVDGDGYPLGLAGEAIPLGARLLAVIDAWFALTRPRTFRPSLDAAEALAEIRHHSGTQFDAQVVAAFANVLQEEGTVPGTTGADDPARETPKSGE